MKVLLLLLFAASFLCLNAGAQQPYTGFIHNNTRITWAAEYNTLVNLTPVTNTFSLKKYYLERLRKDSVKTYSIKDRMVVSSSFLRDKDLQTQAWLSDHYVQPSDHPDRWEFRSRKTQNGYRVSGYTNESCCGCDDADAFQVMQLLVYADSKFTTRNIFLSPLCARQEGEDKAAWYPLGNFAWNTNATRPATASYLTTRPVTYRVDPYDSTSPDILTVGEKNLSVILLKDIKAGKITAHDPETDKKISYEELETWDMPHDTVEVFDDEANTSGYQVVQKILSPSDIAAISLDQDWYFDVKAEKLYSAVRSAMLMIEVLAPGGTVRGVRPFVKLKFR